MNLTSVEATLDYPGQVGHPASINLWSWSYYYYNATLCLQEDLLILISDQDPTDRSQNRIYWKISVFDF